MATRIRLQRHGKKGKAVFHLVVADSRAKRDGKFIEKLGVYNPNTNPATIDINFESTLKWVGTGAEMSDTARAILSYKGILYKNHLLKGVTKGALTAEQVEAKFSAWEADKAARLKAEAEANEAKAKAIEAKNTPAEEEAPVVEAETEIETPSEDVPAEEVAPEVETPSEDAPAEDTPATEEEGEAKA